MELRRTLVYLQPRWRISKTNALLHALRLWGPKADFPDDVLGSPLRMAMPPGDRMLEVLLDMQKYDRAGVRPSVFLYPTEYGVRQWYDSLNEGGVAHCDQFLKVMGELGLPADQPIRLIDGRTATLADVICDSLNMYSPTEELEFTAVAYSRWLPPTSEWSDRFGRRHSLDGLASALLEQPLGEGACYGTHALYGLVNLLRAHRLHPVLRPGTADAVEKHLSRVSALLEANQSAEGAWFEKWHQSNRPTLPEDATLEAITAVGHHLEWVAMAPPDLRPKTPCLAKAAEFLVRVIPGHSVNTIAGSYSTFSHAGRALALLSEADPVAVVAGGGGTEIRPAGDTKSPGRGDTGR